MRHGRPFEIKAITDEGFIEGIASQYGNIDSGGDIVEAGAFQKSILERGDQIPILAEHNETIGIGQVWDAGTHLAVKAEIFRDEVQKAREYFALAKRKAVKGFSIGYKPYPGKSGWDSSRNARVLKEVKLYEVSLVTFPMNESALIQDVKSEDIDGDLLAIIQQHHHDFKAGRAISAATRAKLMTAVEALQSLLADAEADEKSTQPGNHCKDILDALRDIRNSR